MWKVLEEREVCRCAAIQEQNTKSNRHSLSILVLGYDPRACHVPKNPHPMLYYRSLTLETPYMNVLTEGFFELYSKFELNCIVLYPIQPNIRYVA